MRRAICVGEQDPSIFSGSLLDNIRHGAWDAPRGRIEEAVTRLLATCPAFAEMFADQLTPVDQERESKLA